MRPVFTILLVLCSTACLDTHQGLRPREASVKGAVKESDIDFPRGWSRVATGTKAKADHVGYLLTDTKPKAGGTIVLYWVYDKEFNCRGYFSENGSAYVIKPGTQGRDSESIGAYELSSCVAKILSVPEPITYFEMPPPEGTGTPFRDTLAPLPDGKGEGKPEDKDEEDDGADDDSDD
jgi:hypothetical protein